MANYKVVDADKLDADLKSVADSIRAKGGTSEELAFPDGFKSAVDGISAGGDDETLKGLIEGSITELVVPNGATEVRTYLCYHATSLISVSLPTSVIKISGYAFQQCTSLSSVSLTEGLTTIDMYAFQACAALKTMLFPETITTIGFYAFKSCNGLNAVTFKGTPNKIDSKAFADCYKLTTINVPWAEGEVANAPWGATNATINYNYVAEETE